MDPALLMQIGVQGLSTGNRYRRAPQPTGTGYSELRAEINGLRQDWKNFMERIDAGSARASGYSAQRNARSAAPGARTPANHAPGTEPLDEPVETPAPPTPAPAPTVSPAPRTRASANIHSIYAERMARREALGLPPAPEEKFKSHDFRAQ